MYSKTEDLIVPIRTRGPIRPRQPEQPEGNASQRVRTRSGSGRAAPEPRSVLTLAQLLQEQREEVGTFPLTVLAHGWGSDVTEEFLRHLLPLLRREDALWLVRGDGAQQDEINNALVLELSQELHQRTYDNLVSDLVFFPALTVDEISQVAGWHTRTRAVLADSRSPQGAAVLQAVGEAPLAIYSWAGTKDVEEFSR